MNQLIPVFNQHTAVLFVDPSIVDPTRIDGATQVERNGQTVWEDSKGQPVPHSAEAPELTSFLKFGTDVDLLGICDVEQTDQIAEGIAVTQIAFRFKGGEVKVKNMNGVFAHLNDGYKALRLAANIEISDGSYATVFGVVLLELGNIKVNAVVENEDFELLGYKIAGEATNPNRERVERQVTMHQIPGVETPISIFATDAKGSGGAYHRYEIEGLDVGRNESKPSWVPNDSRCVILFQNGPVPQHGFNGVTMEHLLAVAGHRLQSFQAGPFASADNEEALGHIGMAIDALNRRTIDRMMRNVEGKEVV